MKSYFLSILILSFFALYQVNAQTATVSKRTVKNLPADPEPVQNRYTLFSFDKNTVFSDSLLKTAQWDLAFKGTEIIVNGGKIRSGKSAIASVNGNFDTFKEVPADAQFKTDEADDKLAIAKGSGNGWYQYIFLNHEIRPIENKFFVVKTASGNLYKLQILSYYKDEEGNTDAPSRYYTFQYIPLIIN